ncbi:MAG: efflux RND transporter periplasmic adaptor subunit [Deltaproteobacteria bacterium]|jgi:HlyD family secretion protein|nr:efflux RND transporter periplasmic adaptor subunit [Deltaproteobacteria bacterium]
MEKSNKDSQPVKIPGKFKKKGSKDQKGKKTSKLPWIFTILVLLAIVTVIMIARFQEPEKQILQVPKLTNVEVLSIKAEEFIESLALPAILKADRVAQIKPEFTGIFKRWLFPEGGLVDIGDVVAEIDTKSLRLNLLELEAGLKSASQNVILSNITREKAQVNLTNMQENVKIQENALESAESNLNLVKKQHSRVQITVNQQIAKAQVNLANMQENVKISRNALESAESNLNLVKKQHKRVQITVNQQIAKAQANLANMLGNVKNSRNALESAESNLKLAQKQHDRVQEMVIQKITSDAQLDDAQNSLTQAELSVVRAKQNLNNELLNVQVAKLAIKEVDEATASQLDDAQNSLTQAELSVVRAKQNLNNELLNVQVAKLAIKEVDEATASQLDDAQNSLTQTGLSVVRAKQNLNNARLNIQVANLAIKEAEAGIDLANARIAELEASISLLEHQISKGKLKAPFSGILEAHLIEPGEMASPGIPIATIYDLKYLRATIDVPDRYVAFLDPNNEKIKSFISKNMPGAEQRINTKIIIPGLPKLTEENESGFELDVSIAKIAQSSNPESNTFEVELRFLNPGNALKHGLIVRSKIDYLHYKNAIIIPVKAIQVTDAGPRVLVVNKEKGDEVAELKDINPVSIQGSKALIRGGLTKGDRLIVAGWKGLVGGEKVNILVENGIFKKSN